MSKLLRAQEIEQVQDIPFEDVTVPEWNGTVRVSGLQGDVAQNFIGQLVVIDDNGNVSKGHISTMMIDLLSMTLTDDKFMPLFPDENGKRVLGKKSAAVLTRLFEKAQKLSGIGPLRDEREAIFLWPRAICFDRS